MLDESEMKVVARFPDITLKTDVRSERDRKNWLNFLIIILNCAGNGSPNNWSSEGKKTEPGQAFSKRVLVSAPARKQSDQLGDSN